MKLGWIALVLTAVSLRGPGLAAAECWENAHGATVCTENDASGPRNPVGTGPHRQPAPNPGATGSGADPAAGGCELREVRGGRHLGVKLELACGSNRHQPIALSYDLCAAGPALSAILRHNLHDYARTFVDADEDGFNDACEKLLMRAFRPLYELDKDETEPDHNPRYAFRVAQAVECSTSLGRPDNCVMLEFMPSWVRDAGFQAFGGHLGGHDGDVEPTILWLHFDELTQTWLFDRAFLNSHYPRDNPEIRRFWDADATRSSWSTAFGHDSGPGIQWGDPRHPRGFIKIFVAKDKHANYPSAEYCEGMSVSFFAGSESCGSVSFGEGQGGDEVCANDGDCLFRLGDATRYNKNPRHDLIRTVKDPGCAYPHPFGDFGKLPTPCVPSQFQPFCPPPPPMDSPEAAAPSWPSNWGANRRPRVKYWCKGPGLEGASEPADCPYSATHCQ